MKGTEPFASVATPRGVTSRVAVEFVTKALKFSGAEDAMAQRRPRVLGAFAEFEQALIRRSRSALAKQRGAYRG
jgi:hypothetical protein